jgi:hypothetical protein
MSKFIAVSPLTWDSISNGYAEADKATYINIDKIVMMSQHVDKNSMMCATIFFDNFPSMLIRGGDVYDIKRFLRGESDE